jgi:hypothetical protein
VLYLLNKGMVQRMKRDFIASNASLEAAKQEMEKLYAASVSENTLSFVVNDATVSYAGDDYEQVLVHLYMALNYLELGQHNEARVEALQVDIKLREIGEKSSGKFTEDALSRYLSGMIYEELGEWSDAMISYRKAYEAYKKYQDDFGVSMPPMLKLDLLRLAQREGLSDELAQYQQEFGITPDKNESASAATQGELVFVLNNGLAPVKREHIISTWAPPPSTTVTTSTAPQRTRRGAPPQRVVTTTQQTTAPPVLIDIALPFYESRRDRITSARISVSGKQVETQLMENIDGIARSSLSARMPAITARAIARAFAKGVIQQSVDKVGGKEDDAAAQLIGSLLVRVATVATERADTRSWLTLPANVQLARISLPPGSYDVTVELLGNNGQVFESRVYPQVAISSTRKTFLSQHSMPD